MSKVDVLDRSAAQIILWEAICAQWPADNKFKEKFNFTAGETTAEVTVFVNGIEIDYVTEFAKQVNYYFDNKNKHIKDEALEHVWGSPVLKNLRDVLERAEYAIKDAIERTENL